VRHHQSIKEHRRGGGAELLWGQGQKDWKLIQESRWLFPGKLFVWAAYWLCSVCTSYYSIQASAIA